MLSPTVAGPAPRADHLRRGSGEPLSLYTFDDVQVDSAGFRVERAGQTVPLEPKAFDLLVLLLERRGHLVTKQEILDTVWRQTAVSDNALTRIVAHLRKALGDDARDARYIETVPTRGYRWLAPVERRDGGLMAASVIATPAVSAVPPPARHRTWAVPVLALLVIAGALAFGYRRGRTREAEPPALAALWPSQFTNSRGLDAFPALAPSGTSVAYASDRTGGFEIFVRALAAGASEMAVTSDGQQNVQPAWSPDGQYIAFHSMGRGGIWIVPALGGVARQVNEFGSDPAWSPDGQRLAFQSDPVADVTPNAFGANTPSSIWIVGRDGTGRRRLTQPLTPAGGHAAPAWSPDGRRVVFATYSAAPSRLWSMPVDGGPPVLITVARGALFDPAFAPDGRSVYYATGGPYIIRVPVSASTGERAGEPQAIATGGVAAVRHLSLSADGQRLALAGLSLQSNLWDVSVSTRTGEAAGPPRPLTDDTSRRKTTPVFSPDGRWIAYTAARGGSGTDIWAMSAADGRTVPVTLGDPTSSKESAPVNFKPNWMPDSAHVAFLSNEAGKTTLQVTDLTSRRAEVVMELGREGPDDDARRSVVNPALDVRLSPDGKSIAYSAVDPSSGLPRVYVRGVGETAARPLSDGRRAETYPVWSPDGRWLATQVRTERGSQIAVWPVGGGAPQMLAPERGESWVHHWTGDAERIVFAGQRAGVWNVWSVSRRTGKERQVTRYTGVDTFVRYPSASPRGDRIVFELGQVRGNIWVSNVPGPMKGGHWAEPAARD
jgi:Tol biopolymer transport system component/DNA-binding winged helix-turn-helix (wHTH) protein